jgi:hypothetical protein
MNRPGISNNLTKRSESKSLSWWVSRFLIKLARAGYKPGFKWGSEFYYDFYDYLRIVAEVGGRSPVDLAVKLAVQIITLKDQDEDNEDYSWIDKSLKPKSLEDVEADLLLTLEGPMPQEEEDYSWIDKALE